MELIKWNCKTKLINNNIVWMCSQNGKTKENFESLNIEGVQLFTATNYGGTADIFKLGRYNNNQLQNTGPKKLKSIKVGSGFEAVLYQNIDFTGYAVSITLDIPDLSTIKDNLNSNFSWNDQMQSMLVRKYVPPPTNLAQAQFTEASLLSTENKEGLLATLPVVKIVGLDSNSSQNILVGDYNNSTSIYWYRSPDLQFSDPFDLRKISDLQIWLDGTDPLGTGVPPANNTVINTWVDKSGKKNDLIAQKTATYTTNSKSLNFNRSVYNSKNTLVYPIDVFIIVRVNDINGPFDVCGLDVNNGDDFNSLTFGEAKRGYWQNGSSGGSRNAIASSNESSTNFLLMEWSLADNNFSVRRNVEQIAFTNSYTWNKNPKYFQLGSRHYSERGNTLVGNIAEVIVFNRVLSKTERQSIEGYLAWKWGLQLNLPGILPPITSTFNPRSIGRLTQWFDAADPLNTGTPPSDGATLTVWKDKSGNGYDVGKYSNLPLPTYKNSALNSLPTIDFSNGGGYISETAFNKSKDVTVFLVTQVLSGLNSYSNFWAHYDHTNPGSRRDYDIALRNNSTQSLMTWHTNNQNDIGTQIVMNSPTLYSCTMKGGTDMFMKRIGSSGVTSTTFLEPLTLTEGLGKVWVGCLDVNNWSVYSYISEILYFQKVLTLNEIQQVESYLTSKWKINTINHPYYIKPPTRNPYDPTQISGLQLWLDGCDPLGNGLPPKNETVINTWVDKSGNGNDAKGGNSPKFSNKSVVFDGNANFLQTPIPSNPTNETVFIVFTLGTNAPDRNNDMFASSRTNGRGFQVLGAPFHLKYDIWAIGSFAQTPPNSIVKGKMTLGTGTISNGSGTVYVNGGQFVGGPQAFTNVQPGGVTNIGSGAGGDFFNGSIHEVIVFNRELLNTERQWVEGYLAWKWGLEDKFKIDAPFNINTLTKTRLLCWFDANDINGDKSNLANGTEIDTWFDKSGNKLNARKQNASKPKVLANNVNGKSVLDLRGNTQFEVDFGLTTGAYTIFTVQYSKGRGEWQRLIHGGNMSRDGLLYYGYRGDNQEWTTMTGNGGWAWGTQQPIQKPFDKWSIADIVVNVSNNTELPSINGITQNSKTNPMSGLNGIIIGSHHGGGGNFWQGYVAEVLVYDGVVNEQDRQIIQGYLAWKWGTVSNLAENHPFRYNLPSSHPYQKYAMEDHPYSILPPPYKIQPPLPLPFKAPGLVLWFDGADPLADNKPPTEGSKINVWNDKSGKNKNSTSVNGNPTFSKKGIVFDGNSYFNLPDSSLPSGDSSYTFYVVCTFTNNGGQPGLIGSGDPNNGVGSFLTIHLEGTTFMTAWNGRNLNMGLGIPANTLLIHTSSYSKGGERKLGLNGIIRRTDIPGPRASTTNLNILGRGTNVGNMTGTISEILVYDTSHSDMQRELIEGYLAEKWGLASKLPVSNPYYKPLLVPFDLKEISGLQLWLDGVDPLGTGRAPVFGTVITNWKDKSGVGNDATSSGKPIYSPSGVRLSGNKDEFFSTNLSCSFPAESAFAVLTFYDPSRRQDIFGWVGAGREWGYGPNDIWWIGINGGRPDVEVRGLYEQIYGNGTGSLLTNGNVISTNSSISITGNGTTMIGSWMGFNLLNATISEIIVYNRVLTQTERQRVEGYLAWKWGIDSNLTNHPFSNSPPPNKAPFDIKSSSGLELWLDASDSSTISFSSSNNISQWNDKSGKGNNVSQTAARTPPTLINSYANGLSAINMGERGFFQNNSIVIGAAPYSIFAVAISNVDTNDVWNMQFLIGTPTNTLAMGIRGNGNFATFVGFKEDWQPTFADWNDYNANTPSKTVKSLSLLGMTNEGTGNTLIPYFNGVAMDAKNGRASSQTGINIGCNFNTASQYWNGIICEIIIFKRVVSTAERQAIEGYLTSKWGIKL
jgi:hypothetical protein